jgi:hypothetical protein
MCYDADPAACVSTARSCPVVTHRRYLSGFRRSAVTQRVFSVGHRHPTGVFGRAAVTQRVFSVGHRHPTGVSRSVTHPTGVFERAAVTHGFSRWVTVTHGCFRTSSRHPTGFSRWATVTQRVFSDVPPSPNGFSRWATVTQRCFRTCRRHPTRFSRSVTVTQRVFSESLAEASWRWYKTNSWRSFFRVRGTFPLAIAPALHKLFGTKA